MAKAETSLNILEQNSFCLGGPDFMIGFKLFSFYSTLWSESNFLS
jgi:hypothetical protein